MQQVEQYQFVKEKRFNIVNSILVLVILPLRALLPLEKDLLQSIILLGI